MFQRCMMVFCMFLFCTSIHAEVIELDGTIKSLDQDSRAISIVRKTPKGEKVLDLEVAKNAGDIDSLKVGDKISFAYNPDAEIVTKITSAANEKAKEELQGVWVATAVDRHGKMMTKKDLQDQARRIIIEGNTFRQEETRDGKVMAMTGTFTVDPSTGAFDFEGKGSNGNPFKLIGLYEVKGDLLRICFRGNADGKAERPTEFKAREESPNSPHWSLSYTCKRVDLE